MAAPESNPLPKTEPPRKPSGAVEALMRLEKLTQIALVIPAAVTVGWLLGLGLDRLLHQHWIYIPGLALGAVAGFVQLFRMIAQPSVLAGTAPDLNAPAGPGFARRHRSDDEDAGVQ